MYFWPFSDALEQEVSAYWQKVLKNETTIIAKHDKHIQIREKHTSWMKIKFTTSQKAQMQYTLSIKMGQDLIRSSQ